MGCNGEKWQQREVKNKGNSPATGRGSLSTQTVQFSLLKRKMHFKRFFLGKDILRAMF